MKLKFPKFLQNTDRVLSISAIVISLGTFLVLIHQTQLSRQQYELAQMQLSASVMPYLEIVTTNPDDNTFKLLLVNNGLGPAFINNVSVAYKDRIIEGDPNRFLENEILPNDTIGYYYADLYRGRLIPAGEHVTLIGVDNSSKSATKLRKIFSSENARLQIEFASAYGEKWLVKGMGGSPKRLE